MSITAQQLIDGKNEWVTIKPETPLIEAFSLMLKHDYSQLPIIDDESKVLGIVTGTSITRTVLRIGGDFDRVQARDASIKVSIRRADEDLLDLLDLLADSPVLIVDDADRLVGLITVYDTNQFFRQRAEDIMQLQEIEAQLKVHVKIAYNVEADEGAELCAAVADLPTSWASIRNDAMLALTNYCDAHAIPFQQAVAETVVDERFPVKGEERTIDDLTVVEYVQLVLTKWPAFEEAFGVTSSQWQRLMSPVRDARAKLMRFGSNLDSSDQDALRYCAEWYGRRRPMVAMAPLVEIIDEIIPETAPPMPDGQESTSTTAGSIRPTVDTAQGDWTINEKYAPLVAFLESQNERNAFSLTLQNIEKILGNKLPRAAYEQPAWWTDESTHSFQWCSAGWCVRGADLVGTPPKVSFTKWVTNEVVLATTWQRAYWRRKLNTRPRPLADAVGEVGNNAEAVRAYLAEQSGE